MLVLGNKNSWKNKIIGFTIKIYSNNRIDQFHSLNMHVPFNSTANINMRYRRTRDQKNERHPRETVAENSCSPKRFL